MSTYRPITARSEGASAGSGFSTIETTRTRSPSGSPGPTQPYIAISRGPTCIAAITERARAPVRGEHVAQQRHRGVDQVVAEQDREGRVADERLGDRHRVPEPERFVLSCEAHLGDRRPAHGGQRLRLPPGLQLGLEGRIAGEVLAQRILSGAEHHDDVVETAGEGLLDHQLDRGHIHDRQQTLGLCLRGGQEPRSQPRRRDHPGAHGHEGGV